MKKTKHVPLDSGQSVFRATAYSDADVFQLGTDMVDLAGYRNNPVMLTEHNPYKPIGTILRLGWEKKGLRVEFAFDEESEEGKEAMRKWTKGLASSLSIGIVGKYQRAQERMSWALREISQVTVPLDPKATAAPNERNPVKVASSIEQLKEVEQKIKEGTEGGEQMIYLTASVATDTERQPISVQGSASPDNSTNQNQSKNMETNEQHLEHLTTLVDELKASRDQYKGQVETLQASHEKEVEELKAENKKLNEKIVSMKASAKEQDDRFANTTEEGLLTLSEELKDRENKVTEKEASLKGKENELAVLEATVTFSDFLPTGFDTTELSVMDVLKAAAPRNLTIAGMDENALRAVLINEKNRRLKTRLRGSATEHNDQTYPAEEVSQTGYISATDLLVLNK